MMLVYYINYPPYRGLNNIGTFIQSIANGGLLENIMSEENSGAYRDMPKYQSHKKVHAFKIKEIKIDGEGENRETDGSAMITPEEEGFAPFRVEHGYMNKHKPEVGGYYVQYEDGYKSFSPAEAFEAGYTKI